MSAQQKLNFEVRLSDYPLQAVHAACYTFLDRAYISLDLTSAGDLAVSMKPKAGVSAEKFAAIEGKFQEELLHRALRLKLSDNSRTISEYIVAKALSDAPPPREAGAATQDDSLIDEKLEKDIQDILAQVEEQSGGKDSLKVAVPWDEGAKPAAGAQPPAEAVDLESEVKKLLDHAEAEAKVADPAGSPLAYDKLAKKAGRKKGER